MNGAASLRLPFPIFLLRKREASLATMELPTVIDDGVTGYVSCDGDFRIDRIRALCDDPALAHRLG